MSCTIQAQHTHITSHLLFPDSVIMRCLVADHWHHAARDLLGSLHWLGDHSAAHHCMLGLALKKRPRHACVHDGSSSSIVSLPLLPPSHKTPATPTLSGSLLHNPCSHSIAVLLAHSQAPPSLGSRIHLFCLVPYLACSLSGSPIPSIDSLGSLIHHFSYRDLPILFESFSMYPPLPPFWHTQGNAILLILCSLMGAMTGKFFTHKFFLLSPVSYFNCARAPRFVSLSFTLCLCHFHRQHIKQLHLSSICGG